ncbi:hypothetical protein [Sneathiella glossodoripedis]|uniref:hypothetical protein n=1 Tax=Sneathiella glossodoripedis TaxID=418853 RepID=UPI0011DD8797|nr:hypothetical protein [Sneathiella glossodoripedis]
MTQTTPQQQRKPVLLSPRELSEKISRLSQILEFENELLALKSHNLFLKIRQRKRDLSQSITSRCPY